MNPASAAIIFASAFLSSCYPCWNTGQPCIRENISFHHATLSSGLPGNHSSIRIPDHDTAALAKLLSSCKECTPIDISGVIGDTFPTYTLSFINDKNDLFPPSVAFDRGHTALHSICSKKTKNQINCILQPYLDELDQLSNQHKSPKPVY